MELRAKQSEKRPMSFLKSLRLSIQMCIIIVAMLIGFSVVVANSFVSFRIQDDLGNRQKAAGERVELGNALQIGFLQLRRAEKDFLLRLDLKYAQRHEARAQEMGPLFDQLRERAPDEAGALQVDAMRAAFDAYVKQFEEVVAQRQRIGLSSDEGLRGRLRKAVHDAEQELANYGNHQLTAGLLLMRRHEKDFLLRRDPKYIKRLEEAVAKFEQLVPRAIRDEDDQGEYHRQ